MADLLDGLLANPSDPLDLFSHTEQLDSTGTLVQQQQQQLPCLSRLTHAVSLGGPSSCGQVMQSHATAAAPAAAGYCSSPMLRGSGSAAHTLASGLYGLSVEDTQDSPGTPTKRACLSRSVGRMEEPLSMHALQPPMLLPLQQASSMHTALQPPQLQAPLSPPMAGSPAAYAPPSSAQQQFISIGAGSPRTMMRQISSPARMQSTDSAAAGAVGMDGQQQQINLLQAAFGERVMGTTTPPTPEPSHPDARTSHQAPGGGQHGYLESLVPASSDDSLLMVYCAFVADNDEPSLMMGGGFGSFDNILAAAGIGSACVAKAVNLKLEVQEEELDFLV